MRTTLNLDDDLVRSAAQATGETRKTELIRIGLCELVEKANRQRLIDLGGSAPDAKAPPRRRPPKTRRGRRR